MDDYTIERFKSLEGNIMAAKQSILDKITSSVKLIIALITLAGLVFGIVTFVALNAEHTSKNTSGRKETAAMMHEILIKVTRLESNMDNIKAMMNLKNPTR